jgi:ADP-heptose:LPS heptosyltransferase
MNLPRYDASLLAFPAARSEYHILARLHGARTRVAHDYWPGSRSIARRTHDTLVPVEPKHNVLRNLDLVRALGIDVDPSTSYAVPRSWVTQERHDDRIAIHVGTVTHHGLSNKRWPVDRFAELARRLAARGFEICVIAGPDEREESKRVAGDIPGARLIEGGLEDIARFLSGCAAAVTNDSGIGHLAAAVGTTVLALHGPTPLEGGPYGPVAKRFRPSACPPCFDPRLRNTECALGIDFACLRRDLTVDAVENELLLVLSNRRSLTLEGQATAHS